MKEELLLARIKKLEEGIKKSIEYVLSERDCVDILQSLLKDTKPEREFCSHCKLPKRMKGDGTIEQLCTC